jgi:hypothetical protein
VGIRTPVATENCLTGTDRCDWQSSRDRLGPGVLSRLGKIAAIPVVPGPVPSATFPQNNLSGCSS